MWCCIIMASAGAIKFLGVILIVDTETIIVG